MLSSLDAYSVFQRGLQSVATAERPSSDPAIEVEVAYFRQRTAELASLKEFIEDPRLLEFATRAYGFGDDPPNATALGIAIEQGASDLTGYAGRAPDYRIEELVRGFGFAEFGPAKLRDPVFIDGIVTKYRNEASKAALGLSAPESQEREYFRNKIGEIDSAEAFVADRRLYDYAMTAFGLTDRAGEQYLIQSVLAEGATDTDALAYKTGDDRLVALARTFGFGDVGTEYVQADTFTDTIARRYDRVQNIGQDVVRENESDESAYFRANIGNVSSIDDLLADKRLYDYVMTAYDLRGDLEKKGLVRKVLEEGVSQQRALGNRLGDPRYAAMTRDVAFAEYGTRNLTDPDMIDQIAGRYERVQREIEAGANDPTVELAAYFDRKADSFRSWFDVLGDSRLRSVATRTLGVPDAVGNLGIDALAEDLQDRFDIEDFADAEKRADFIKRYLILNDSAGASNSGLVQLFRGNGDGPNGLYNLIARL